jgi:hypothetical protein
MMDRKEIKRKWMEALRSGKYKQGTGCLRTINNKFCCLGVLADVIDPERWEKSGANGYTAYYWRPGGYSAYLPSETWEELMKFPSGSQETFSNMNDGGMSFEDIADYIERWPY